MSDDFDDRTGPSQLSLRRAVRNRVALLLLVFSVVVLPNLVAFAADVAGR